eukprot:PLAT12516.17.p1 GENE.PLAT12516.17~~PLAT12516.17.p1  ORF type:complete len:398 (-),score=176.68 PLAT12516.17:76-1212(-)
MSLFASAGDDAPLAFKAGRMVERDAGEGRVKMSALATKGLLLVKRAPDSLVHVQWKDRTSGETVLDLITFPGVAEYVKVDTGREKDRVYLLRWLDGTRRFMFWMQDASSDNDEENCEKLNSFISDPAALDAAAAAASGGGAGGSEAASLARMMGLPPGLSDAQIMQMMGRGAGGRGGGGAAGRGGGGGAGGGGGGGGIGMADLQAALGGLGAAAGGSGGAAAAAAAGGSGGGGSGGGAITASDLAAAFDMLGSRAAAPRRVLTPLSEVLSGDEVAPIVESSEDMVAALLPHLPEGQQTPSDLLQILHSPQLAQAVDQLTGALQSENFNSILSNFGLDPMAGAEHMAAGDGVMAFLAALQASVASEDGAAAEEGGEKAD